MKKSGVSVTIFKGCDNQRVRQVHILHLCIYSYICALRNRPTAAFALES